MENRRKFYTGGLWVKHTIGDRYEKICWALDAYNNGFLDEDELKFIIKNGFVSKIYISEGVVKKYKPSDFGTQANLFNEILKGKNNVLGTDVFDICKAVESRGKAYNTKEIIIEHVVPAKVYLGDVKEKYAHNMFTFEYFKKVFDAVSICLVTKKEDKKLGIKRRNSKGKGEYTLVSNMPEGREDNFIDVPFARYDDKLGGAGIEIHGWRILNGIPFKEVNNTIFFESDEEFEDFCVAPYATIKQSENGTNYRAGDYSDIYKECVKEGKLFVIKDRNSKVYKRQAVTKRVPLNDPNSPARRETVLVQLKVQNMKQWYPLMEKMLKKKEKRANDELSDTNS